MGYSRSPIPTSDEAADAVTTAVICMFMLFAERVEHDVGGWPVAYIATKSGAFLWGYGYAVSDPMLKHSQSGSLVPLGTAAAGGFSISLCELGDREGIVVYWLQRAKGIIFQRTQIGYQALEIEGRPSLFTRDASAATGHTINVFFGEQEIGSIERIGIMLDDEGNPSTAVAIGENGISFSVLNVSAPFRTSVRNMNLLVNQHESNREILSGRAEILLSADKRNAEIRFKNIKKKEEKITVSSAELDSLIADLGELRAQMSESISREHESRRGMSEMLIFDPIWRAGPPVHESLQGIELKIRHPGFGWLRFMLPHHEARAIGEWLSNNARKQED